ncbi:hypothetical protein PF007_g31196 [Phytophthora fragariae]|uniref:Uncharacterized protein n=1 Tax=Phytophthora fragariae TaxID=53985 RepID=A0A6A3PTR6_9STRA|nr:hypothetical protein PF009_g30697 [Phytophthora fragariae]KAE9058734.1 hypothetical protein PF007_g31196 [Phytophthora fragariae]
MLLDCGTTTIYVSSRWVAEHQLRTMQFSDKTIRVDNKIVESELEVLPLEIQVSGLDEAYKTCSHKSTGDDVFKEQA